MTSKLPSWSDRVEQELACAVRASDVTARNAHLELAILHQEAISAGDGDPGQSRKSLTTALFTRMAFVADDAQALALKPSKGTLDDALMSKRHL